MPTQFLIDRMRSCFVQSFVFCGMAAGLNGGMSADDGDVSRQLGKVEPKQLKEISGMEASRKHSEVLWLHNDGDKGRLFAVSTDGSLIAEVNCSAEFTDWEDIAIGPGPEAGTDYLYQGDIGDNDEERSEIRIVRFAEPELSNSSGNQIEIEDAEVFRLSFPDGPHDAEALFIDSPGADLYIVTKERKRARLYTIPIARLKKKTVSTLTKAGKLDVEEVSASSMSADGGRVILRREAQGWLWQRREGESVAAALQRKPQLVPVLGKRQGPNGEAICFAPTGNSYYTVSEGKKQPLYEFAVPSSLSTEDR